MQAHTHMHTTLTSITAEATVVAIGLPPKVLKCKALVIV